MGYSQTEWDAGSLGQRTILATILAPAIGLLAAGRGFHVPLRGLAYRCMVKDCSFTGASACLRTD